MSASEFVVWLGNEFQKIVNNIDTHQFEDSKELVHEAIKRIDEASSEERALISGELNASYQTRMIGDFDKREENDVIEEILVTLEGYIE